MRGQGAVKSDDRPDATRDRAMQVCAVCEWYMALVGHAGICQEKWRKLPWNAAVPLTGFDNTCEKFKRRS